MKEFDKACDINLQANRSKKRGFNVKNKRDTTREMVFYLFEHG